LIESQLAEGVSSVASATVGLPRVGGIWLGARSAAKRLIFRGNDYQSFLYQEFLSAWKRAGE
jgi:hypothetical protein